MVHRNVPQKAVGHGTLWYLRWSAPKYYARCKSCCLKKAWNFSRNVGETKQYLLSSFIRLNPHFVFFLFSGAAPKIPFGNGVGQLHKAATKACPDANFAVSAVNYDYVDSGLVGAFIVSEAAAAGKVGQNFWENIFVQFQVAFWRVIAYRRGFAIYVVR